ncbi:MAG TPA: LysR family transcriptional regulator [Bryobacteraceae bacterium]|nr:LysR family transcriptional regulator [Bryobacteraceae bacterium]
MNSTLDEWDVVRAVVRLGGYAAAARHLNRSQSTISYTIAKLQEKLGIQIFTVMGRKASLTESGRVLLAQAEPHLSGFEQLEQRARSLASGGQSEIRLSADSLFPNHRLFAALAQFSRQFPYVHLKLQQGALIAPDVEFSTHDAHLCISGIVSREYFVHPILEIRIVAVARWDHPLHQQKRQVSRADMLGHTLVNIEAASVASAKRQPLAATQRYLSVRTIEAAVDAVRSGFCFGWLPTYRIQGALDSGELIPLRMSTGAERQVRLNLICTDPSTSSQELLVLAELLGMHREVQHV